MSQTTTAASSQAQPSFDWVLSCFSKDALNRLGEDCPGAEEDVGAACGDEGALQEVQVGDPLPILRKGGATLAFLAEKRGEASPRVDVTSLCRNTFVHLDTASPLARLSQPQLIDSFRAFSNRLVLTHSPPLLNLPHSPPPLKAPTLPIACLRDVANYDLPPEEDEQEEETAKTPLANISQQEFDAVWREEGTDDIDPRTDEDLCAGFPMTTSWPGRGGKLDKLGQRSSPSGMDPIEPFFHFLAPSADDLNFHEATHPSAVPPPPPASPAEPSVEAHVSRTPSPVRVKASPRASPRVCPSAARHLDFDLQAWLGELTALEEREQAAPLQRGRADGVGASIVRGNLCDIVTDYHQIASLTNIFCCTIAQSLLQAPCPAELPNDESTMEHGAEKKVGVDGGLSGHPHSCKPCAFYWSKGCLNGDSCQFCHLWHAPKKKKPMKEQKNLMIIARDDGKISFLRCAIEDALGA